MTILPNLQQQIDQLRQQNEKLMAALAQANKPKALSFKVTAKKEDGTGSDGAISVYGLGRFPVTLYLSQWERVFAMQTRFQAFVDANDGLIARK